MRPQSAAAQFGPMNLRRPAPRWAAWAFALALLLKAAVPMLASASALAQGKTLVEVCTVYGVATVALVGASGEGAPAGPEHAGAHGQDHCALTALLALAAPEPQATGAMLPVAAAHRPAIGDAHSAPSVPDACATWIARLKHGPPVSS